MCHTTQAHIYKPHNYMEKHSITLDYKHLQMAKNIKMK